MKKVKIKPTKEAIAEFWASTKTKSKLKKLDKKYKKILCKTHSKEIFEEVSKKRDAVLKKMVLDHFGYKHYEHLEADYKEAESPTEYHKIKGVIVQLFHALEHTGLSFEDTKEYAEVMFSATDMSLKNNLVSLIQLIETSRDENALERLFFILNAMCICFDQTEFNYGFTVGELIEMTKELTINEIEELLDLIDAIINTDDFDLSMMTNCD